MARRRPRLKASRGGLSITSRVLLIVGVAVFLIADVLLIGYALNRTEAPEQTTPNPIPTFGVDPGSTPTPIPEPETPAPSAAPRLLDAVDATTAWRATPGSCGGQPAIIERSDDAGATWLTTEVANEDVQQVLALDAVDATTITVVARTGEDCELGVFASFSNGDFWQPYPERLGEFIFLEEPTIIATPAGQVAAPCEAREAIEAASSVALACDSVLAMQAGVEWSLTDVPGLLAIAPGDDAIHAAVVQVEGCGSIAIQSTTITDSPVPLSTVGCLPETAPVEAVTLSSADSILWVWTGADIFISTDTGQTWS